MRPTTKRLARIAGFGVGMLAVAGALLWLLLSETRGPLIQGKPVAYWTRLREDRDAIDVLAGEKAVAIPALVRQLSLPDSRVKDSAERIWLRLPVPLRERVPKPITPADLRVGAAFALAQIYDRDGHPKPTLSEAQMMLPALTKALQDRDVRVRASVAVTLGYLGVISGKAIEACDLALKDWQLSVRVAAVASLGRLGRDDERAITCLKSAVSDPHVAMRDLAASELERLRVAPRQDDPPSAAEAK